MSNRRQDPRLSVAIDESMDRDLKNLPYSTKSAIFRILVKDIIKSMGDKKLMSEILLTALNTESSIFDVVRKDERRRLKHGGQPFDATS